ncbi:hypothetical protein TNCV_3756261 [Trichonephila clavipes]|nr:hypothetical protein TNCV_3756261 [Trichonephila clavipes]
MMKYTMVMIKPSLYSFSTIESSIVALIYSFAIWKPIFHIGLTTFLDEISIPSSVTLVVIRGLILFQPDSPKNINPLPPVITNGCMQSG